MQIQSRTPYWYMKNLVRKVKLRLLLLPFCQVCAGEKLLPLEYSETLTCQVAEQVLTPDEEENQAGAMR